MRLFGETLRQVGRDFRRDLDEPPVEGLQPVAPSFRPIMQLVVSVFLLFAGLIVLTYGGKEAGRAAAGIMGIVVGYWLR